MRRVNKMIRAAGVAEPLERALGRRSDARSRLNAETLLTAVLLNARQKNHHAEITSITAVLNSLNRWDLQRMGSPDWGGGDDYSAVQRLVTMIAGVLDGGPAVIVDGKSLTLTHQWYQSSLLGASVPYDLVKGAAVALDGTAVETFARLHSPPSTVEVDGTFRDDDDELQTHQATAKENKHRAAILGVGEDGRNIYTKDRAARAGFRTATASEPSRLYVGREAHIGVAVPSLKRTDRVSGVTFGRDVPPLIVSFDLVPAGTHRGHAVLDSITGLVRHAAISEVIVDPGYSLMTDGFLHPMRELGLGVTFRIASHQRGLKDHSDDRLIVDGQVFSQHLPEHLHNLAQPSVGSTTTERRAAIEKFNERAVYADAIHQRYEEGHARYRCAFCVGRLRTPSISKTMRKARASLVDIGGATVCCSGIKTIGADTIRWEQPTIFGTSAWDAAYGRRNLAETVNSRLKVGGHTNIGRGFIRLLDEGRIQLLMIHTIVALNMLTLENWHDGADTAPNQRRPRKDRVARLTDLSPKPETKARGRPPD